MLISFIDVLYGIAIGTGFMSFPENPFTNQLGTVVFLCTLFITAQDWYQYHTNANVVPEKSHLSYFIIQIFVVLALNQMFVHSSKENLVAWLLYLALFGAINIIWNIITPFENHMKYAVSTGFFTISAILLAYFYQHILNFFPSIDARWLIIVTIMLIFLIAVNIFELTSRHQEKKAYDMS